MGSDTDRSGKWLDVILAAFAAVGAFWVGLFVAVVPCYGARGGWYCSGHGSPGIFVAWLIGLVCAVLVYRWVRRAQRSSRRTPLD